MRLLKTSWKSISKNESRLIKKKGVDALKSDYRKLRGLIIEKFGTQDNFAQAFGMTRQNFSLKMNDKSVWKKSDMAKVCKMLDQPVDMIPALFFAGEVDKS